MTDVSIFTGTAVGVRVGSSTMAADAVQIARDYLAGYTGDYYFFQVTDSDYCLLQGSGFEYFPESGTVVTPDDYSVVMISELIQHGAPDRVTDTFSGTMVGTEESVFRGSYVSEIPNDTKIYVTQTAYFSESCSILNPNSEDGFRYVVYGSMKGLPSLISGSDYYGFAQTFLFLSFAAAWFIMRVFRHVRS